MVKKGKNNFCGVHFFLGQIILSLRYIKYDLGSEDLQLVKPIYDAKTGTFQGLEENIGLIRSNSDETFFNYGSDEKNSSVLCSVQKRSILNAYSGT